MYKSIARKAFSSIKPWHALIALILLNLFIALFIGRDFGEGWDETMYYLYGERSLDAYPSKHIFFSNLRYYGPFYAALGKFTVDFLSHVLKGWSYEETWHLVNFGFFQAALIGLYIVARRFLSGWASFGVVLLLATQPLIFGHAFINPKDIPFMTFFLASIASGFIMLEEGARKFETESSHHVFDKRYRYSLVAAILFGLYTFSIVGRDVISSLIGSVVSYFYTSDPSSISGRLFALIADRANQLPVESYIHKAANNSIGQVLLAASLLFVVARWAFDEYKWKQGSEQIPKINWKTDVRFVAAVTVAGILLGLTTSIRLVAPLAGVLLAWYAFQTVGKKSLRR